MKGIKLGFIVEGNIDKIIVETLAQRLLPPTIRFYTVRLGGIAAFSTVYTTVITFIKNEYDYVIILFDTDSINEGEIGEKKFRLEETLRPYRLNDRVTVCPVVPQIEAWLLAHYLEQPEIFRDLKSKLSEVTNIKKFTDDHLNQIAQTVDIELIKHRNASFANFTQTLHLITSQPELTV